MRLLVWNSFQEHPFKHRKKFKVRIIVPWKMIPFGANFHSIILATSLCRPIFHSSYQVFFQRRLFRILTVSVPSDLCQFNPIIVLVSLQTAHPSVYFSSVPFSDHYHISSPSLLSFRCCPRGALFLLSSSYLIAGCCRLFSHFLLVMWWSLMVFVASSLFF